MATSSLRCSAASTSASSWSTRTSGDAEDRLSASTVKTLEIPLPNGNCRVRARLYRPDGSESFLVEALVVLGKARVRTTLAPSGKYELERAFDLDQSSFFWSNSGLHPDDHVTLELFGVRTLKHAHVTTGDADKPDDKLQHGVLEVLPVGGNWTEVASFSDGSAECDLPQQPIRAVRIRATEAQTNWLRR